MARGDALLRLNKALMARRDELRKRLGGELKDLRNFQSHDPTGDSADQAFDTGSEEVASQLAEIEAKELHQIERALDWLDALNTTEVERTAPRSAAMRIFDAAETEKLDAHARGYLLHLEQIGILEPSQRELVIDRLLALDNEEIDVEAGHQRFVENPDDQLVLADGKAPHVVTGRGALIPGCSETIRAKL